MSDATKTSIVEQSGLAALDGFMNEAKAEMGLVGKLSRRTVDAAYFEDNPPPAAPTIVEGLFKASTRVGVVAETRARKTFFSMQLAMSVAAGTEFVGYPCKRKKTLYANLELPADDCHKRFTLMRENLGIKQEQLREWLFIGNYEGVDFLPDGNDGVSPGWEAILKKATELKAEFVVVDPYYMLTGDENDIYVAKQTVREMRSFTANGIALVVVFHAAKGMIGDRQIVDRISGSGVVARDFVIISLAKHANIPDAVVMEKALRSFPDERGAETLVFKNGHFEPSDVRPVVLDGRTKGRSGNGKTMPTKDEVLAAIGGGKVYTCTEFQVLMKDRFGMARNAADELRKDYVARGLLESWTVEWAKYKPTYTGTESAIRRHKEEMAAKRQRKIEI